MHINSQDYSGYLVWMPKVGNNLFQAYKTTKKLGFQEDIKLLVEADLPTQEERWIFKRIIDFC